MLLNPGMYCITASPAWVDSTLNLVVGKLNDVSCCEWKGTLTTRMSVGECLVVFVTKLIKSSDAED